MKVVLKTAQTIIRTYFVEVPDVADPQWACDGLVMNELEEYSQKHLTEDILSTQVVNDWPEVDNDESINAAVMKFDQNIDTFVTDVMWRG